ncbi:hypothetical protein AAMO2058_000515200 [Amorphochlora amoebiformis]
MAASRSRWICILLSSLAMLITLIKRPPPSASLPARFTRTVGVRTKVGGRVGIRGWRGKPSLFSQSQGFPTGRRFTRGFRFPWENCVANAEKEDDNVADADILAGIKKMRVSEIRKELDDFGVRYKDLLEKKEYVERLYQARTGTIDPQYKTKPGEASGPTSSTAQSGFSASSKGSERPPSSEPNAKSEPSANSEPKITKEEAKEQVSKMKIKEIKAELDERGVDYKGLLEKSEYVNLLVQAKVDNIRITRGQTKAQPGRTGAQGTTVVDAEIVDDKEFEREQKAQEDSKKQTQSQGGQMGGSPFGGMGGGGNPFGGMGGMPGGMGGMPGMGGMGGMPGGMGGMGGRKKTLTLTLTLTLTHSPTMWRSQWSSD